MRALTQHGAGGPEVLSVTETDTPAVRPGGLLIRTVAAALNFHDVDVRRRGEPGIRYPAVPGTDVVGDVVAVGSGVTGHAVGDRVAGLVRSGGFAEYALVPAQFATPVPAGLDPALAACVPTAGLCAWFLVADHVPAGARAVVCRAAAGSVGLWLGALLGAPDAAPPDAARAGIAPAGPVEGVPAQARAGRRPTAVGIVSTAAKADLARRAGYHVVLDRSAEPDLVRAVKRATGGFGATVVLDGVGGPGFADSFRFLHPGGTVVSYGRAAGPPSIDALPEVLLDARRNLGLRTWFLGRTLAADGPRLNRAYAELVALLLAGRVTMPVTELPLEEARHGYALLESGSTSGKVVFRP